MDMDRRAEGGNWDKLSPEVLIMIFDHLTVPDLLSCSVITKNWKKAARDVLKRSRECYAHIKYFHRDIQALNQMVTSTDIMEMINGLHIRNEKIPKEELGEDAMLWASEVYCYGCSNVTALLQSEEKARKLEEAKQSIAGVLSGQWQYLNLDMGSGWRNVVSLHKGFLLREVVFAASDSLQKLVIGQYRDWKFVPCCGKAFTKLKVIQAEQPQSYMDSCIDQDYDSSLKKFAPNLERITGAMMTLDLRVLLKQKRFLLKRMKNVRVAGDFNLCDKVIEHGQCVSGLYQLDLQYHSKNYDVEQEGLTFLHSFVFPFALRSLDTLKELRMYTLDLYKVSIASDGLKFPNLERLYLATHRGISTPTEISALKNINFPKLFPNLEKLELARAECGHYVEDNVIPVGEPDGMDQSDMPVAIDFVCRGRDGLYKHEQLEFFNTIYPKLNKVRILKLGRVHDYEMSKLWEFQSLEYLEINACRHHYEVEFGIEALLCGINIEEAQLPRLEYQKQRDKLDSCIVPIRSSLWNAKSLKELKISEERPAVQSTPMVRRSWVTQVTENLPERHVRNMTVTFDGTKGLYDRLNRLRAFTLLRANKINVK